MATTEKHTTHPVFGSLWPLVAILQWYFFNVSTVMLNKWSFQVAKFSYPFTLTLVHMITCSAGSILLLDGFKFRKVKHVDAHTFWKKLVPLAALFVTNTALGNISLRWVPVSFMQTIKASVPFFTCAGEVLFTGKRYTVPIYLSLIPVVGGLALSSAYEVNFETVGFLAALLGSVTTAAQLIISKILLSGEAAMDSFNLVYHLSPVAAVMLLPITILYELPGIQFEWSPPQSYTLAWGAVVSSGITAFVLNISRYVALGAASALTCTVAGNVKVFVVVFCSAAYFRNEITTLNGVGCFVTVFGALVYNVLLAQWRKRRQGQEAQRYTS